MADVTIAQPQRGVGEQNGFSFAARAITLTWAWGVNPSPGAITYVAATTYPNIVAGAWVQIDLFGRTFYGVIKGGPAVVGGLVIPTRQGSDGHEVRLDFVDTRLYLGWDRVFGTFNQVETKLVGDVWKKRYWHILPENFEAWRKTYTDAPLSAAQILDALFGAPTVGSPWVRVYHPDQDLPHHQAVDCQSGRALNEVVQEICDFQGLTLTVAGGPYRLVFARKGDGLLPAFPANSDDNRLELSLSDAPTRVFVVGDRNLCLVLNVAMEPDWNRNWEEVFHPDLLAADLFKHESDPVSGLRYNAIPDDTEHARGWQLAKARALDITVQEYAALRMTRDALDFSDSRRFGGRSRLNMPAALYLRTLLFRAFRPPASLVIDGRDTPVSDLRLVNEQVAFVSHDIQTGIMTASLTPPTGKVFAGGNGYAIARGYNLGGELFGMIEPDRFNLDDFTTVVNLWQPVTYGIDEAGDGSQFVLFDDPVINSGDLVTIIDGWAVLKANPTLQLPEVRAALTFEGGRFVHTHGTGSRDDVLNVSGLRREMILDGANATEVPYADGQLAGGKAAQMAQTFLARPWIYRNGGYRLALRDGEMAPALVPTIGRLTLEQSAQGNFATVEFEQDRPLRHYTPETLLDRQVRMQSLLPGQQELRAESHAHKLLAAGLKAMPQAVRLAKAYLQGRIGDDAPVHPITIEGGVGALPAGTPLWKRPPAVAGGKLANTQAAMPAAANEDHTQFAGVVVRDGERADGVLRVQRSGTLLARVRGPVAFGDSVVASPGNDYLVKKGESVARSVGSAQMAIENTDIRLIPVLAGVAAAGTMRAVWG